MNSLFSENLKEGNAAPIVIETAFCYDVRVNAHLWQGKKKLLEMSSF
ncbi:MAG: hypothetical protein H8E82_06895 [Candidatus Marinimicrobia bacterium]|nr:hypothetical protein [Candidatus Neomarinimicrobiota bacterium]